MILALTVLHWSLVAVFVAAIVLIAVATIAIRARNMQYWLCSYCRSTHTRSTYPRSADESQPTRIFLCVCDHYEPEVGKPGRSVGRAKVERWTREYPELFSRFRDCRGRVPQHTFFFPQDEYSPEYLDMLAELCAEGYGDVDVHLHHHNDTAEQFRDKLVEFRDTLYHRHGLLRQDPQTGDIVYGFIHGNWALCNSRPDGHWCGVDEEIPILLETGCYADFTMPSAPSNTQTKTINSIYYAQDIPGQSKSHDQGIPARVGSNPPPESLLMIQGPLGLDWGRRRFGVIPRIENGDLHAGRPADLRRFELWQRAGIHVSGRPDWIFLKLHTHGCKDGNIDTLLSRQMQDFHRGLEARAISDPSFRYYYVTAWEMAQLVHQAEQGVQSPEFQIGSLRIVEQV